MPWYGGRGGEGERETKIRCKGGKKNPPPPLVKPVLRKKMVHNTSKQRCFVLSIFIY
jgi:hypothetical protein